MTDTTIPKSQSLCACGCGQVLVPKIIRGKPNRFAYRHFLGRKPDENYIGVRFNYWTGLRKGTRHGAVCCRCECGTEKDVSKADLSSGRSSSCGCRKGEAISKRLTERPKRGIDPSKPSRHPLYPTWRRMLNRCYRTQERSYPLYGGRGIGVCARWRESFDLFAADMGLPPTPKHSIDRIDVNGNYEPGNCRWATDREQQNNKRSSHYLTFEGVTQTVSDWARVVGIDCNTLYKRIRSGWPAVDVLYSPLHLLHNHKVKTERASRTAAGVRVCARCQREKPLGEFGKLRNGPDGIRTTCKRCRNGQEVARKKAA